MSGLEVAGTILGIASAGIRLAGGLYEWADDTAAASDDMNMIGESIETYATVLELLGIQLQRDPEDAIYSPEGLRLAKDLKGKSELFFGRIQAKLPNNKSQKATVIQKLSWYFVKARVQLLLSHLEKLKTTVALLLQILILARSIVTSTNKPPEAKEQTVSQLRTQFQKTRRSVVSFHKASLVLKDVERNTTFEQLQISESTEDDIIGRENSSEIESAALVPLMRTTEPGQLATLSRDSSTQLVNGLLNNWTVLDTQIAPTENDAAEIGAEDKSSQDDSHGLKFEQSLLISSQAQSNMELIIVDQMTKDGWKLYHSKNYTEAVHVWQGCIRDVEELILQLGSKIQITGILSLQILLGLTMQGQIDEEIWITQLANFKQAQSIPKGASLHILNFLMEYWDHESELAFSQEHYLKASINVRMILRVINLFPKNYAVVTSSTALTLHWKSFVIVSEGFNCDLTLVEEFSIRQKHITWRHWLVSDRGPDWGTVGFDIDPGIPRSILLSLICIDCIKEAKQQTSQAGFRLWMKRAIKTITVSKISSRNLVTAGIESDIITSLLAKRSWNHALDAIKEFEREEFKIFTAYVLWKSGSMTKAKEICRAVMAETPSNRKDNLYYTYVLLLVNINMDSGLLSMAKGLRDQIPQSFWKNNNILDGILERDRAELGNAYPEGHDKDEVMNKNPSPSSLDTLIRAVVADDLPSVEYCFRHGAPVNTLVSPSARDGAAAKEGESRLHYAAERSSPEVLGCLLRHPGIDISICGKDGRTALHAAIACQDSQWSHKRAEKAQLLLIAGASATVEDDHGDNAAFLAGKLDLLEVLRQMLADKLIDVDHRNSKGLTMLHLARLVGSGEWADCLIPHGANTLIKRPGDAFFYEFDRLDGQPDSDLMRSIIFDSRLANRAVPMSPPQSSRKPVPKKWHASWLSET